ncbi:MAG: Sugar phosphate isomerase/epimerase [Phycisphaerales bacterium]|nr:Sugar phosphate isomerase/epimerase [Phycisphaerales bacterium]MDB5357500.1 Sugar phosphate isomerase/epimerase [Phycisphaerales bacterium]
MNSQHTRRDVLRFTTLAAASAALPAIAFAEDTRKRIPIGLELYSVRNELGKDFTGVIEAVGKMGYAGVEFAGYYGWDKRPAELRRLLDDNGLKCCGTHTHLDTLEGDNLKKTIELHKTLGNKFLICPSLSAKDAAGWMDLAKKFNDISARAKESGMLVGYHSHAGDFKKFDGNTGWEIFFDNTNADVVQQIDTGNTLEGGGDPLALIKKYPGRTKTTHVKEHGGAPDAPVGEGTIEWKPLFEAYESVGGIEWYIVEHEAGNPPLKTVKACLDNLHKMGR